MSHDASIGAENMWQLKNYEKNINNWKKCAQIKNKADKNNVPKKLYSYNDLKGEKYIK